MGRLIRCITSDGMVMARAIDSTDIVSRMEQIHKTSAVMTAAGGRLITAAAMMGSDLKDEAASLTLRIALNDGPSGTLIAVADSDGNSRIYLENPVVEIPLNSVGKLDVAGAIGRGGVLYVIKDFGSGQPYNGLINVESGEIAEDIAAYFAKSEQIPTVCALGVLVNPDLTVKAAGGYILQLLPGADDECISKVEDGIKNIAPMTDMLSQGLSLESIIKTVLKNFDVEVLEETHPQYKCNCSRERVLNALRSMAKADLEEMANDDNINVKCHFCDKEYNFSSEEIRKIISRKM